MNDSFQLNLGNIVWHSPFKLYLYPTLSDEPIEESELIRLLMSEQFIGKELSKDRFATGEKFLSLLTFMGCSPNIEIDPQVDKPFCYIEIESFDENHFISGKNIKAAQCPECKTKIERIENPVTKTIKCANCNTAIDVHKLNWRKSAFIAKYWITVGNIYELEAIPSDQLLSALHKETKQKWKAAYIRD